MKTLLLADRYLPHRGGSRRYYHEVARRLPGVTVLTGHQPGERAFDRQAGLRIVRRRGIRPNYAVDAGRLANPLLNVLLAYLPGMAAMVFWTALEMIRNRPGVIHAGGYAFAGLAARLLGPLFRIPYLVYAHGEDISSTLRRRFFRGYMFWILRGADRVVANCEHSASLVARCGVDPDRIVVGYPGVDIERFADVASRPPMEIPRNMGPVLLSVGRLVPHKGQATVIRSLPRLLKRWPNLIYFVVGEGAEMARLRTLVDKLRLQKNVHLMGGVDDASLGRLYAATDLFVQPNGEVNGSLEGYGMVYLEANLAGLAVIGGRSGGVPEAVIDNETGLLVPPFEPDALAEAVNRLLEDDGLRARLARAGRKLALRRGWDNSLAAIFEADRVLRGDLLNTGRATA
ncbi:MAG: glycosyltransferase family 4 protein [bacterium]|nr:glycosyltransferase family 4 protein [bacterium]